MIAWYTNNSGARPPAEKRRTALQRLGDDLERGAQAHEVAQKRANGSGLYNTLRNVWERVNDWYDENYYQQSPSQDPLGR